MLRATILFIFLLLITFPTLNGDEKEFSIVTYNVLADKVHYNERVPSLLNILKKSDADIIALQEVAPWFIQELLKEQWIKKYHLPKLSNNIVAPRGLLILSKNPISNITYDYLPTRQYRAYFITNTNINGVDFTIATCHLESPLNAGLIRAKQLEVFFKKLKPFENVIFLGDFNFGDGEQPETKNIPNAYKDMWTLTNPKKKGYTWNIEVSSMAKAGSFPGEKSRRIDRILYKSSKIIMKSTEILGNESIDKNKKLFPSDHFGLRGTFTLKQEIKRKKK